MKDSAQIWRCALAQGVAWLIWGNVWGQTQAAASPIESNYHVETANKIRTQLLPWAKKFVAMAIRPEDRRLWNTIDIVVADNEAQACVTPIIPAGASIDFKSRRRQITLCARTLRWMELYAELQVFSGMAMDQKLYRENIERLNSLVTTSIAIDHSRMLRGYPPQKTCNVSFAYWHLLNGKAIEDCRPPATTAEKKFEAAYVKWMAEGKFISEEAKKFVGRAKWRGATYYEFLNGVIDVTQRSILVAILLHEFGHHRFNDVDKPAKSPNEIIERELRADRFALATVDKMPEPKEYWDIALKDGFRFSYLSASIFTAMSYSEIKRIDPSSLEPRMDYLIPLVAALVKEEDINNEVREHFGPAFDEMVSGLKTYKKGSGR